MHLNKRQQLRDAISDNAYDFLMSLLAVDPIYRLPSASKALRHKWLSPSNDCTGDREEEEERIRNNSKTAEREIRQSGSHNVGNDVGGGGADDDTVFCCRVYSWLRRVCTCTDA
jgi:hypothetical protein